MRFAAAPAPMRYNRLEKAFDNGLQAGRTSFRPLPHALGPVRLTPFANRFIMSVSATSNRVQEFRSLLPDRVFVADGAMGTMLYSQGVFINRCFDELNLSSASLVKQIHQDYVKAGA